MNELENIFSELIIGLDELNDQSIEDAKVKDLKNNSIDENKKEDILNEREVENNIKDINQNYPKEINLRWFIVPNLKEKLIKLLLKKLANIFMTLG